MELPIVVVRFMLVLVLVLAAGAARPAAAQVKGMRYLRVPDSTAVHIVKLADGSTVVGRFIDVATDPLRFETSGGVITIRRADLREIKETQRSGLRSGEYWPDDPNPSRLFFGPTARVLPANEADFSSTYLFLLSGSAGVGGVGQLGAGLSVLPLDDFSDNLFFVTGKVGIPVSPKVQFAVGGLAGWAGGFDDDIGGAGIGAVYGVGTFGTKDHAFTGGIALPFGDVDTKPVFLLGGETRVGKRVKLVTENYFVVEDDRYQISGVQYGSRHLAGVFGYGFRIFGDKIAVDLAFLNSTEGGVFPGVPYVDFVVRF